MYNILRREKILLDRRPPLHTLKHTQTIQQEIASSIKRAFESEYGKTWHCIVGRNFSTHVTHEEGAYIYFYIGQTGFMLFATA